MHTDSDKPIMSGKFKTVNWYWQKLGDHLVYRIHSQLTVVDGKQ
jgi:hypothetical protein